MKQLQLEFLDHGVLTLLKNWLEPLPNGSLPNINICAAILKLLTELPIDLDQYDRREQLKRVDLGRLDLVIMFLSKSDEVTTSNRKLKIWSANGDQRAMSLMVDPGLYENKKSDILWVQPNRPLPTAFKLFTGSAWMVLSRSFVEYCIWGWDNLPRTLLMYYTSFVSSTEGYFQMVVYNVPEFIPTVVNHGMHFISWDNPPKQHPHVLNINDTGKMIKSGAAFAHKFDQDTGGLDRIDDHLLHGKNGSFTPGGWCKGTPSFSKVGKPTRVKPGPGAKRLRRLLKKLIQSAEKGNQCR